MHGKIIKLFLASIFFFILSIIRTQPVFAVTSIADKGDTNNDGVVNILDFNLVVSCFEKRAVTASCTNKIAADVNKDGVIDGVDYTIVIKYFGLVVIAPTPTPASFDQDLNSIDSSLNQLDSDLNSVDQDLTPAP